MKAAKIFKTQMREKEIKLARKKVSRKRTIKAFRGRNN